MKAKISVPVENFKEVNSAIKESRVKFYPYKRYYAHYEIEFEPADHPLTSFLLLKYSDIKKMS